MTSTASFGYIVLFALLSHVIYVHFYPPSDYNNEKEFQEYANTSKLIETLQNKIIQLETQLEKNEEEILTLLKSVSIINNIFSKEVREYINNKQIELEKAKALGYDENTTTISVTKRFSEVPSFISYLPSLKTLKLSSNKISELPPHLFYPLINLQVLHFAKNHLTEVPDNLLRYLNTLEELYLGMNKLSEVPKEIKTLTYLKSFYIQNNLISSIDPSLFSQLVNLEKLDIGYNQLTILPPSMFQNTLKMRELFFRGNQISSFPSTIYSLSNLEAISCASNKISEIDWDSFLNLKNLKSIDIRDNQLQFESTESLIKYFSLENFSHLKEVYLQGNKCGDDVCKEGNYLQK